MTQILIAGAGPVGLAVGCELLRRGVDVRIVDRSRPVAKHSKAILVWPRTLELLSGIGVANRMVDEGHLLDGVRFYSGGAQIGTVHLTKLRDSRFNHLLMLPQWATERILLDRFTELGGKVEWHVALTGLAADRDGFDVELTDDDGRRAETRVSWLVGTDGAHSTVRKALGVGFDVASPNMVFAVADAPVCGDLAPTLLHYFYSERGSVGVGPLGHGLFRFAVSVPDGQEPTQRLFQAALDQSAGRIGTVGEPRWSSLFTVRVATADRFRVGRAFLAGDAAHVISPASGQGLNTGFHDAVNLGWKLAGTVRGQLDERVLDTYDTERRAAVRRVSAITAKQTRWGLLTGRLPVAVRDTVVRGAAATGVFQRVLAPLFSQTDVGYGPESAWWQPKAWRYPSVRAGGRIPYLADLIGRDDASTTLPTLVVSQGRMAAAPWRSAVDQLVGAAPVALSVVELPTDPRSAGGRLARLLGAEPTALLVRPDGHVLTDPAPVTDPALVFARLRQLVTI
jgi:2-polyprenyl-6-methoxyphenol hydroxylase-like FAD-dependent oxidoreductase